MEKLKFKNIATAFVSCAVLLLVLVAGSLFAFGEIKQTNANVTTDCVSSELNFDAGTSSTYHSFLTSTYLAGGVYRSSADVSVNNVFNYPLGFNFSGSNDRGSHFSVTLYDFTLTHLNLSSIVNELSLSARSWSNWSYLKLKNSKYYIAYNYNTEKLADFNFELFSLQFQHQGNDTSLEEQVLYTLTDSKGVSLYFVLETSTEDIYYPVNMGTVYSNSAIENSDNYGLGYTNGQSAGYNSGYSAGKSAGYNSGYSAGETAGYNAGLSAGADVSWLNLFGATIDAPLQAFNGLLNFDLKIGNSTFNLYGFLLAMFSVALIICLIRWILAK